LSNPLSEYPSDIKSTTDSANFARAVHLFPPRLLQAIIAAHCAPLPWHHLLIDLSQVKPNSPEIQDYLDLEKSIEQLLGMKCRTVVCNASSKNNCFFPKASESVGQGNIITSLSDSTTQANETCYVSYAPKQPTHNRYDDELKKPKGTGGTVFMNHRAPSLETVQTERERSASEADDSRTEQGEVLIVHDIDRAPRPTQAALLQLMNRRSINLDGIVHIFPKGQLVIATYKRMPLPQREYTLNQPCLDLQLCNEFLLEHLAEKEMFQKIAQFRKENKFDKPIRLMPVQQNLNCVHVSAPMDTFVRDLIVAVRQHCRIVTGPSLQGRNAILLCAKMHALFSGVDYVRPIDVCESAVDALCHRVLVRVEQTTRQSNSNNPATKLDNHLAARLYIFHLVHKIMLPPAFIIYDTDKTQQ
jgi:hypothetical protein